MPYFTAEKSFISVPTSFIRDELPSANATFIKVYIYLLMLAEGKTEMEYSEIASILGILESDLIQAIKYWEGKNLLFESENTISFSVEHNENIVPSHTVNEKKENLADIIIQNKELSDMFMLAQEIFGKTITENDMQTIYWFYSDLKMPIEVILMLLEYCVSKGKNRMSYIEKVAVSWNEMGLNNAISVTEYLQSEEKKTGFLYSIRKLMGILDRSLSQTEENFLNKWHDELNMSEEMIALAYEYCIIQTAKLSFPYMDKIITRWHSNGISTIAEAEADNKKFKNKAQSKDTDFSENEYNGTDLERLTRNNND